MIESPMYQEIMQEGRIDSTREHIREILASRFGAAPAAEFVQPLRGISDLSRLSELFRLALGCRKPTEFRKALDAAAGR